MRRISLSLVAIIVLLVLVRGTQAEVHWLTNLEDAKKQAAATNRLVLVHFWAHWCPPCKKVEKDVFKQPGLGEALAKYFVPVKLHYDHHRSVAQFYGIKKIPSDVIINPRGEELFKTTSPPSPEMYLSRMRQVALKSQGIQDAYAHLGSNRKHYSQQDANASLPAPPTSYPGPQVNRPVTQMSGNRPFAPNGGRIPEPTEYHRCKSCGNVYGPNIPHNYRHHPIPIRENRPPFQPQPWVQPQKAEQAPPVAGAGPQWGLDGYCPVRLVQYHRWQLGDRRWGVNHENKTYLFSGPEEQQEFLRNPYRYAPVLSGNDPVLLLEERRQVAGRREHGVEYRNQIYLFATEASLSRFVERRGQYAQRVQAMAPRNIQRR